MSPVNVPLLRKAVEWAEAEAAKPPELCEWVQDAWFVARSLDDPNVVVPEAWDESIVEWQRKDYDKAAECGTCYCIAGYVVASQGERVETSTVEGRAARLLGLEYEHAYELFAVDNTIEDVRRIAEELAGERL